MKIINVIVGAAMLLLSGLVQAAQVPGPLVDSTWLAANQDKVVILDVRKDVKSFTAQAKPQKLKSGQKPIPLAYGHIPGAHLINFKYVRSDQTVGDKKVQKMLPAKVDFEKLMQAAGVNKDSAIVITSQGHDNSDMTMATRLYWQLKYFGHDNIAILNGGVSKWIADGHPVSHEPSQPTEGDWQASAERGELLATSDEVAKAVEAGNAQIVDNRAVSLYLGTWNKGYVYGKGHIPGAKLFSNELMTDVQPPAVLWSAEEQGKLAAAMGIDVGKPIITYCNSGHLASGGWFIFHELLGNKDVQLYDGSMHQWTQENRPLKAMVME